MLTEQSGRPCLHAACCCEWRNADTNAPLRAPVQHGKRGRSSCAPASRGARGATAAAPGPDLVRGERGARAALLLFGALPHLRQLLLAHLRGRAHHAARPLITHRIWHARQLPAPSRPPAHTRAHDAACLLTMRSAWHLASPSSCRPPCGRLAARPHNITLLPGPRGSLLDGGSYLVGGPAFATHYRRETS